MTPTRRSGTLSSGVGDCGLRIADCGIGSGEDGGWRIEDGDFGSVAAGDAGEKPIFKGVCAAGEICAGVTGNGFNFSGKFGSAEASGAGCSSVCSMTLGFGLWALDSCP